VSPLATPGPGRRGPALVQGKHIPVLTVRQPWAWALQHGKPVENRPWEMTYRGLLWLHAGARSRWDPAGADSGLVQDEWLQVTGLPDVPHGIAKDIGLHRNTHLMVFGAVTALLQVTGCHHADDCTRRGSPCNPWAACGQWHIERQVLHVLPEPVPCRGMLGLWRLPEDAENAVRAQLEEDL